MEAEMEPCTVHQETIENVWLMATVKTGRGKRPSRGKSVLLEDARQAVVWQRVGARARPFFLSARQCPSVRTPQRPDRGRHV